MVDYYKAHIPSNKMLVWDMSKPMHILPYPDPTVAFYVPKSHFDT